MIINYDYYRIFYYVAKYKNFTQAANILLNNQPNITRSIKNLESSLGCTLFIRSNRGAKLTPEGEKLFSHISIAFEQIQAGEEELSRDKSLQSGIISIGASETALHGLLLPVLNKFHRAYPGIKIRISNHSTPQAVAALKNGIVDIAVVTTPTGITKSLTEKRIKPFKEILICGTAFSYLKSKTLHLKEIQDFPLICLSRETKTYEFYNKIFLKYGLALSPDMEAATTDQILPMVKNNLGLGFLPKTLANEAIENGEILELDLAEEIPERYICMLKRSDSYLNIAAKELERMILNHNK